MRLFLKILGSVIALLLLAIGTVYALSARTLSRRITITEPAPAIPTDAASIAHGRHLTEAVSACVSCHRPDFAGQSENAFPFGRFTMANLTKGRGGHGNTLTDAQMVHAIRHGVGEGGRPLLLMPSEVFRNLDDADVAAIVAYIRSVPPVDSVYPTMSLGPLGRTLLVTGKLKGFIPAFEIDHDAKRDPAPPAGATMEYGRYLVSIAGCQLCHGAGFSGGPSTAGPGGGPPPANITPEGLKAYDEAAFFVALREGKRPGGAKIDSAMPWSVYGKMTDDEIRAVWKFLQTVPPKAYGNH